jgi:hypothetical protein
MPKGIGQRGIGGRAGLARRQIGARYAIAVPQQPYNFPPGTHTWSPPKAGYWKFVYWGGGGGSFSASGGSGAYGEVTRFLTPAQSVSISVGMGGHSSAAGQTTTLIFSNGLQASASGGANDGGAGGTATGGDVNLSGSAGVSSGSISSAGQGTGGGTGGLNCGGGAPANLPYHGGNGGNPSGLPNPGGGAPGGGAGFVGVAERGADGAVFAVFLQDS